MRKRKKKISKGEALLLVVMGLFLGTVFTFGNQYWNGEINQNEAISKEAMFESYEIDYGRHRSIRGIQVDFFDDDQLYINGECVNEKLEENLSNIKPGTRVTLMTHPNSDTILDMRTNECVILEFNGAQDKIGKEGCAFFIMGLMLYATAIYGIVNLIPRRKRK